MSFIEEVVVTSQQSGREIYNPIMAGCHTLKFEHKFTSNGKLSSCLIVNILSKFNFKIEI